MAGRTPETFDPGLNIMEPVVRVTHVGYPGQIEALVPSSAEHDQQNQQVPQQRPEASIVFDDVLPMPVPGLFEALKDEQRGFAPEAIKARLEALQRESRANREARQAAEAAAQAEAERQAEIKAQKELAAKADAERAAALAAQEQQALQRQDADYNAIIKMFESNDGVLVRFLQERDFEPNPQWSTNEYRKILRDHLFSKEFTNFIQADRKQQAKDQPAHVAKIRPHLPTEQKDFSSVDALVHGPVVKPIVPSKPVNVGKATTAQKAVNVLQIAAMGAGIVANLPGGNAAAIHLVPKTVVQQPKAVKPAIAPVAAPETAQQPAVHTPKHEADVSVKPIAAKAIEATSTAATAPTPEAPITSSLPAPELTAPASVSSVEAPAPPTVTAPIVKAPKPEQVTPATAAQRKAILNELLTEANEDRHKLHLSVNEKHIVALPAAVSSRQRLHEMNSTISKMVQKNKHLDPTQYHQTVKAMLLAEIALQYPTSASDLIKHEAGSTTHPSTFEKAITPGMRDAIFDGLQKTNYPAALQNNVAKALAHAMYVTAPESEHTDLLKWFIAVEAANESQPTRPAPKHAATKPAPSHANQPTHVTAEGKPTVSEQARKRHHLPVFTAPTAKKPVHHKATPTVTALAPTTAVPNPTTTATLQQLPVPGFISGVNNLPPTVATGPDASTQAPAPSPTETAPAPEVAPTGSLDMEGYNGTVLTPEQQTLLAQRWSDIDAVAKSKNLPAALLASLVIREGSGLQLVSDSASQGFIGDASGTRSYPAGPIDSDEFRRQLGIMADIDQGKINDLGLTDISYTHADLNSVANAEFAYNGVASTYKNQSRAMGITNPNQLWMGSPYVANLLSLEQSNQNPSWSQFLHDYGDLSSANNQPGAILLYIDIHNRIVGNTPISTSELPQPPAITTSPEAEKDQQAIANTAMRYAQGAVASTVAFTPTENYLNDFEKVHGQPSGETVSDCGEAVATDVVSNGIDPSYPLVGTGTQLAYLEAHPNKYAQVSYGDVQAGDILIFDDPSIAEGAGHAGHTYIYVGEQSNGYNAVSASLGGHAPQWTRAYPAQQGNNFKVFRVKA